MNSQLEKLGPTQMRLRIEIPETEFSSRLSELMGAAQKTAQIIGTRSNNPPEVALAVSSYRDVIVKDLCDEYIKKSFSEALLKHNLTPLSKVQFTKDQLKKGLGFSFTAEFEVKPEIKSIQMKDLTQGLNFEVKVTEQMVTDALENLRQLNKRVLPNTEERAAQVGDWVLVDIAGEIDGQIIPTVSGQDHHLELGQGVFIKEFETQLSGMRAGENKHFKIHFPESYPDAALKNKEVNFKVRLKQLCTVQIPDLDEAFFKSVMPNVEPIFLNLNGLKEILRREILSFDQRKLFKENKIKLLKNLASQNQVECPKSLLEVQTKIFADEFRKQESSRLTPSEIENLIKEKMPEFEKASQEMVKTGLLVEWIARKNNITCSPQDFEQFMQQRANELQMPLAQIKLVFDNLHTQSQMLYAILEDKVVQLLLNNKAASNQDLSLN